MFTLQAQDVALLFREAEQFEKAFRDNDALAKYLQILRHQPRNLDALCKVSELYSVIGKRLPGKEKQKEYYPGDGEWRMCGCADGEWRMPLFVSLSIIAIA